MRFGEIKDREPKFWGFLAGAAGLLLIVVIGGVFFFYTSFYMDVGNRQIGVVINHFGEQPEPGMLAKEGQKGLREEVFTAGKVYLNRLWAAEGKVYPRPNVPEGKVGVLIALYGQPIPGDRVTAPKEAGYKGIHEEPLPPGDYPVNALVIDGVTKEPLPGRSREPADYAYILELYPATQIPPGYFAVHTIVDGEMSQTPNGVIADEGAQGVQPKVILEGTRYANPYKDYFAVVSGLAKRDSISPQKGDRPNDAGLGAQLDEALTMTTSDGFLVDVSGVIESRIKQDQMPRNFVLLNEAYNDDDPAGQNEDRPLSKGTLRANIEDEFLKKVMAPYSTSFVRDFGLTKTAVMVIGGEGRQALQEEFFKKLKEDCGPQGLDILQTGITNVGLPTELGETIREREIARLQIATFSEQTTQQESEKQRAIAEELVARATALVTREKDNLVIANEADKRIAEVTTQAKRRLDVAKETLLQNKQRAEGILAESKEKAEVIQAQNLSEVAFFTKAIAAFGGDGAAFVESLRAQKLGRAIGQVSANSADSPLMKYLHTAKERD
jgi:hypothetical protein